MTRITRTLIAMTALYTALGSTWTTDPHVDHTVPTRSSSSTVAMAQRTDKSPLVHRQKSDQPGIYGATIEQTAEIEAAMGLFAAAGLRLPHLRIYVHATTGGCNGYAGLFNKDRTGNRIDICGDIVRHELAHAWEHHHMSDETRTAFMNHVGLTFWNDGAVDHEDRAIEHVARVIAWGVGPGQLTVGEAQMVEEQLIRYELLTGRPSPKLAALAPSQSVTATWR